MKTSTSELSIRPLHSESDYLAFEALQREIWGPDVAEVVSAALAEITQKIGGIAAGAFGASEQLVGFVFGFTGLKDGKPVHWSHMLAVKSEYRECGIGRRLKLYQREVLLKQGIETVYWTFDPLVAKNAHLNFNLLGACASEYVEDMYGTGDDSELFRGIGTDRFVMTWRIADQRVKEIIERKRSFDGGAFLGASWALCRQVGSDPASPFVSRLDIHDQRIRVEVPADIHQLMGTSLEVASEWRKRTREAFQTYFRRRYSVVGFYFDHPSGRCFYCMEQGGQ